LCPENGVEGAHIDHRELHRDGHYHGAEESLIGQKTLLEKRFLVGSYRQGVGELCKAQHREDHRLPFTACRPQGKELHGQDKQRHEAAHPDSLDAEPAGKDAVLRVSRGTLHDVIFRRFHGKREGGKTVGDEVDPEDMYRQKGDREAQDLGKEYRHDFPGIC